MISAFLVAAMLQIPALSAYLDSLPAHLRVSIIVEEIDGNLLFEHGADNVVPSASVIKIPILAAYLNSGLNGDVTIAKKDLVGGTGVLQSHAADTTLTWRRVAELMISVSDNSATNAIIRTLGMDRINQFISDAGFEHTRLRRLMMDFEAQRAGFENTTTPREMNAILRRYSAMPEFVDILLLCEDDTTLPAGFPAGTRIAHKTGTLTIVRGDAGIVLNKSNPIVVSAFVTGFETLAEAEAVLASIGTVVAFYMEEEN